LFYGLIFLFLCFAVNIPKQLFFVFVLMGFCFFCITTLDSCVRQNPQLVLNKISKKKQTTLFGIAIAY